MSNNNLQHQGGIPSHQFPGPHNRNQNHQANNVQTFGQQQQQYPSGNLMNGQNNGFQQNNGVNITQQILIPGMGASPANNVLQTGVYQVKVPGLSNPGSVQTLNQPLMPGILTTLQKHTFKTCFYQNRKWNLYDSKLKDDYQQKKAQLRNNFRYEQFNNSCMFILSDKQRIWIDKRQLYNGFFDTNNEMVDLTPVFRITNRTDDIENALFYCLFGQIELSEFQEMTYFLLACVLLKIEKPFYQFQNYITSQYVHNQQNNDHQLVNSEEILDLLLFIDQSTEYNDIFKDVSTNFIAKSLLDYKNLLISKNNKFFISNNNYFNEKIKNFSENYFISNIISYVVEYLIPDDVQYVSLQLVETFYSFIQFYYNQPQFSSECLNNIKEIFGGYYRNKIQNKLTQEDQIECIKYLPPNSDSIVDQLKAQFKEIQELELRELAFIRVLITERPKNVVLENYRDHFKQSFNIQADQDPQNSILEKVDQEIFKILNSQQQQLQYMYQQ